MKYSCFLGLISLLFLIDHISFLWLLIKKASFQLQREKNPTLSHSFIINHRCLLITRVPFFLFPENPVSLGKPISGNGANQEQYFLHTSTAHSVTLTSSAHSDPTPLPGGYAISVNLKEQFPRDDAADICKEGKVQVMTISTPAGPVLPLNSNHFFSQTSSKVQMPSSLGGCP